MFSVLLLEGFLVQVDRVGFEALKETSFSTTLCLVRVGLLRVGLNKRNFRAVMAGPGDCPRKMSVLLVIKKGGSARARGS